MSEIPSGTLAVSDYALIDYLDHPIGQPVELRTGELGEVGLQGALERSERRRSRHLHCCLYLSGNRPPRFLGWPAFGQQALENARHGLGGSARRFEVGYARRGGAASGR
jgi:hypothetical protein